MSASATQGGHKKQDAALTAGGIRLCCVNLQHHIRNSVKLINKLTDNAENN